jgi:hypothetical protein
MSKPMKQPTDPSQQRQQMLRQIVHLARKALLGTISETYRTCGTTGCNCHHGGPKHGPHCYVSYRGDQGKTTGYYVPKPVLPDVRQGVQAWGQLQDQLRKLAQSNRERLVETTKSKKLTFATGSS